jgi:hypothetical protein
MQIKLTNQQILTLEQAITALDGKTETQIVDGKPVQTVRTYRVACGARWALARNAGRLSEASAAFHRVKSALITQHTGGEGAISPANGNFNAFARDYEQLAAEVVELDLHPIAIADLKMEDNERAGNEYPIAVLNALQSLMVEGNVG